MLYKLLAFLFLLTGCYTTVLDPLRVLPESEPPKIESLPEYHDAPTPQIRRDYYGRFSHPSYYSSYYPLVAPGYYQPPVRIIYVNERGNKQVQPYVVAQVKEPVATPKKDIERQRQVWQKRIDPRIRKAPTPTPKR